MLRIYTQPPIMYTQTHDSIYTNIQIIYRQTQIIYTQIIFTQIIYTQVSY